MISNCGYYDQHNSKLNKISKSSATQSTLIIDDQSSCKFNNSSFINKGLKIQRKDTIFEKNYWKISASHDGYLNNYDSIHERKIEFYPDQMTFFVTVINLKKKGIINNNFTVDFS
mgnify:CR=1 FL=1